VKMNIPVAEREVSRGLCVYRKNATTAPGTVIHPRAGALRLPGPRSRLGPPGAAARFACAGRARGSVSVLPVPPPPPAPRLHARARGARGVRDTHTKHYKLYKYNPLHTSVYIYMQKNAEAAARSGDLPGRWCASPHPGRAARAISLWEELRTWDPGD
jgi:hypothetical protein